MSRGERFPALSPNWIPLACPHCGKVRFYCPGTIRHMQTHLCASCSKKKVWKDKRDA